MQSEHIRERISKFDNKLYLEFGGKLFDDYHASRVLPGFEPDSKLRMLMQLSDQAEIVIVIGAPDIEKNKIRGDLGITYDEDVLRLMNEFTSRGLYVGSVCITRYSGQDSADAFKKRLEKLGIKVYVLYNIPGYPSNTSLIVSDEGYGKNDYIETTRPLVVITAPGPGSGKMATCLEKIIEGRQDTKAIGFGAEVASKEEQNVGELFKQVMPEDLIRYGLIPEFVGRVPVVVTLDGLDENALLRILQEPKNALTKQYHKLFELDGVELDFEDEALRVMARNVHGNAKPEPEDFVRSWRALLWI